MGKLGGSRIQRGAAIERLGGPHSGQKSPDLRLADRSLFLLLLFVVVLFTTTNMWAQAPVISYQLTAVHSFGDSSSPSHGAYATAGLIQDGGGNFYGSTMAGGSNNFGMVYKLTPDGLLTTLYSFAYDADGGYPMGRMIQGMDGAFYGTTSNGEGGGHGGTVFRITPAGVLAILNTFVSTNGSSPKSGLIQSSDGNFYGTTWSGGSAGGGTVYKMTSDGSLTTLVNFTGANGSAPYCSLVEDADGNYYGTTSSGGSADKGTVFKMTAAGVLTTLHSFLGVDGSYPYAELVRGSDGNFYGCTYQGGANDKGTIFKITPAGVFATLYVFMGGNDGAGPYAGLVQATDGNFYGTTSKGGSANKGTVFRIASNGSLETLYAFTGGNDGASPYAGLIQSSDGNFYGTVRAGAALDAGIVYKLSRPFIDAYAGASFTYQIKASNNPTSYAASGLPDGLTLNAATGVISGLSTTTGVFRVTVSAVNTSGTSTETLTITLAPLPPPPVVAGALNATGTVSSAFSYQITASNRPTSYDATRLPAGLSVNTMTGVISGTPTTVGTSYATITATNAGGSGNAALVIVVAPPPMPVIVGMLSATGTVSSAFSYQITGSNNPTSYDATGLPAGLSVNTMTGVISGMPTTVGVSYTTISATNQGGTGSATLIITIAAPPVPVIGSSLQTLFTFTGNDGKFPYSCKLTLGSDGNFYGTTRDGGTYDLGTVFKLTPSGTVTTLYSFNGTKGESPFGGVIQGRDGNFYGTTHDGGSKGLGTVFKVTPSGVLTTLCSFTGANGANPYGRLVQGSDGNFYGTTYAGNGTIFKITSSGTLTTLCTFTGTNGRGPLAGLIQGSDGDFYGTTTYGGSNDIGTVFKITSGGILTTLYSFTGANGKNPSSGVIQGSDGNFYGTTGFTPSTVYRMTPSGVLTTLCSGNYFSGQGFDGGVIQGSDGNFYGTAQYYGEGGYGTIFKVTPDGRMEIIWSFRYTDGSNPNGLIQGPDGSLYGTNTVGGSTGYGTVFKLTPLQAVVTEGGTINYQITASNSPTSYAADGLPEGLTIDPLTGLIRGTPTVPGIYQITVSATNAGGTNTAILTISVLPSVPVITSALNVAGVKGVTFSYQISANYSPTSYGASGLPTGLTIDGTSGLISGMPTVSGSFNVTLSATNSIGTGTVAAVLDISPPAPVITNKIVTLASFTGANGSSPASGLIQGSDGNFYGTTTSGGSNGMGSIFRMSPSGTLTTLYSFPRGVVYSVQGLIQARDGNFYGMTYVGGSNYCGTVFRMTPEGVLTTLHSFAGTDGKQPYGEILEASDGNFYGTTSGGGSGNAGTVFKMTPSGVLTTLCSFMGNGSSPKAGLVEGRDGNFYGTTYFGGSSDCGTVFKVTRDGTVTVVFSFSRTDGAYPLGTLVKDHEGNFYGTTYSGGSGAGGTVFKLTPAGVLTTMCEFNNTNGMHLVAGVAFGKDGNLYGSTSGGGSYYRGTAFMLTLEGVLTTLHSFYSMDGFSPTGVMLIGRDGHLYGTTGSGGGSDCGVIFKLTPSVFTTPLGQSVNYQVSATNDPASYSANGLPPGLVFNTKSGLISGVPTKSGTFEVIVGATNGGGSGLASIFMTIQDSFMEFRSSTGLTADGSQDVHAPAGDGVPNLFKYAFNMIGSGKGQATSLDIANNQTVGNSGAAGLPSMGVDEGGKLSVVFVRRKAVTSPGVNYVVEFCDDLSTNSWVINALATESVTDIDSTVERVTVTDSLKTAPKRFVRVRVVAP